MLFALALVVASIYSCEGSRLSGRSCFQAFVEASLETFRVFSVPPFAYHAQVLLCCCTSVDGPLVASLADHVWSLANDSRVEFGLVTAGYAASSACSEGRWQLASAAFLVFQWCVYIGASSAWVVLETE